MKKVRECFHMLITAVICLMVSMVPGKNVTAAIAENNAASEILSTRERHVADRFTQSVMDKMRSLWISSYLKLNRFWKKLFLYLHGTGDIKTKTVSLLFRNKKTVFGSD